MFSPDEKNISGSNDVTFHCTLSYSESNTAAGESNVHLQRTHTHLRELKEECETGKRKNHIVLLENVRKHKGVTFKYADDIVKFEVNINSHQ